VPVASVLESEPDIASVDWVLDEDDEVSPDELCDEEEVDEFVPWSASMLPPWALCQVFSSSRETLPSLLASIAEKLPAIAGAAAVSSCSDREPSELVSACVQWLVDMTEFPCPVAEALVEVPGVLLFDEFG
jgi:hypothetical protein